MSRAEWIESILILLCTLALLPMIRLAREEEPLPWEYRALLVVAGLMLAVLLVRRFLRLRRAFRDQQRRPPGFPF
ncbi:MAG: hypothetical protein KatS3mg115_0067 [Candidatus Poribacteria bacterium]|nr:MAG: hypothetical protein KatS3mg115_0067 [Candidatus Poribacteria bacterium]